MHLRNTSLALFVSLLLAAPALAATPTWVSSWGSLGSGAGQFNLPWGVAVDFKGDVWVADYNNHRLQKFDGSGAHLLTIGGFGSGNGQLNLPHGVAVDGADNVYVTEQGNHRVQKFSETGAWLMTFGSNGTGNGQFNTPLGIAVDGSGNIFVADGLNHRIQKFNASGAFLTKWGSFGSAITQFRVPQGLATDGDGNVYVADQGNHRVQKFDGGGTLLLHFGMFGLSDGQLTFPQGIAVNSNGNIFVASLTQHHVQKFAPNGDFLEKFGVNGSAAGEFNYPGDITVANGDLYVVDSRNHRVTKWNDPTPRPTLASHMAVLDIEPGTYPNRVNETSGVIRVALMGGARFDLSKVRTSSLRLEGCPAVRYAVEDVGVASPPTSACNMSTLPYDGVDDLVLEFRVNDLLRSVPMTEGETRTFRISGQMTDGSTFEATDCLMRGKALGDPAASDLADFNVPTKKPVVGTAPIEVTLPAPTRVGLDVIDVTGRVVTRLFNDQRSAGSFTIEWDQRGLPSGVYFVRMTAGERVVTRPVTIAH